MSECGGHALISDFKVGKKWKCSGCGNLDTWGETWSYFGSIGCRKCGQEPVILFVACSDACRKLYEHGKTIEARSKVEAELARVSREAEQLAARRDSLQRKLDAIR